jgi:putative chitinase
MTQFSFDFNKDKFYRIISGNKNPSIWFQACVEVLPKYDITTELRIAHFLSQCGHESLDFTVLEENLNYSSEGLVKVFGKYFPNIPSTTGYARKPEKIANRVYANRMSNGPESSGDGYKFRGRGIIQLTGKSSYTSYASHVNKSVEDTILSFKNPKDALDCACWFWNSRNLNKFADANDILTITKLINGGKNGLDDRTARYSKAIAILRS